MAAIVKGVFILFVFFFIDSCQSDSLVIGTSNNAQLAFAERVKLSAIPLKTRTKNVFYTGSQVIKGISAVDMVSSESSAIVTSGGVGSTFTNIRLKSQRGGELDYQIQIFV